jgi:hypothetical protein
MPGLGCVLICAVILQCVAVSVYKRVCMAVSVICSLVFCVGWLFVLFPAWFHVGNMKPLITSSSEVVVVVND